jgi:hypothetical protein
MRQLRRHLRFPHKALVGGSIGGNVPPHQLQGDLALQALVVGGVNLAHAALLEESDDAIPFIDQHIGHNHQRPAFWSRYTQKGCSTCTMLPMGLPSTACPVRIRKRG